MIDGSAGADGEGENGAVNPAHSVNAASVDLNADLGESVDGVDTADDEAMFAVISSASIATGGHAGDAASMRLAVERASAQGWRRPLLAWLQVAQARAEAGGASDEVARLQRRIDLLQTPAKR